MKTNENPTVSIIVPIHNVESYLYNCLESIKRQTFNDFEVLLVNDGSDDGSEKICCSFCAEDKRFNLINQKQMGVSEARNTGLKLCRGKYISMIDGDDYIHPKMIEVLYNALNEGDYDFSMVKGLKVWNYIQSLSNQCNNYEILYRQDLFRRLYGASNEIVQYGVVWNKLYNKNIIKDESFKTISSEDCEFNNRIFLKTKKAILIDNTFYYWFQRNTSLTHVYDIERLINNIDAYCICLREIPDINKEERACCILKLFRTILSVRQFYMKDDYNQIVMKKVNSAYTLIKNEFLFNVYIPVYLKILFLNFYYIPVTYSLFVYFYGLILKYKNTK